MSTNPNHVWIVREVCARDEPIEDAAGGEPGFARTIPNRLPYLDPLSHLGRCSRRRARQARNSLDDQSTLRGTAEHRMRAVLDALLSLHHHHAIRRRKAMDERSPSGRCNDAEWDVGIFLRAQYLALGVK
jgi:hypothetical protein